jgi:thermitase
VTTSVFANSASQRKPHHLALGASLAAATLACFTHSARADSRTPENEGSPTRAEIERQSAASLSQRWARGHILVKPKPGMSEEAFDKILKRYLAKHSGKKLRGDHGAHVVNLPLAANEHTVADLLGRDAAVEYAEVDRLVEPDAITTNDTYFKNAWHLPKIGATDAWSLSKGAGVTIAILDSGVDGSHPDLAPLLVPGWNLYDNNSNTADVFGHGTKVAGAAAALSNNALGIAAVSWQSKIMPLRVSLPDGTAYLSTIANAITYAADHGARIANVSFQSSAGSPTIQNAAQYMKSKGGMVVVSAGNTSGVQNFAASDSLIAVSATTSNDARASWSSYGAYVDVAAPGAGIYSTTKGGGYAAVSGTSFAAPVTAGVIALMMSRNPSMTPAQIEAALKSTAVDLGTPGRDDQFGAGRINAAAAVGAAAGGGGLTDTTAPATVITAPGAGTVSGVVSVNASATDASGVSKVELFVGGTFAGTDTAAPYAFAWDSKTRANGAVSLVVRATDTAGNVGVSAPVSVTISNTTTGGDVTGPTIEFVSPAANATVPSTLTIRVNASDAAGIARMQLNIDALYKTAVVNTSSLTYTATIGGVAGSKHSIGVYAWDTLGNKSYSVIVVRK